MRRWVASRSAATDSSRAPRGSAGATATFAAFLGNFIITFDAVVVTIALPTIGRDMGGGIAGLQWVADGYTLMFAALLLSSGSLSDRIGGRRAFGLGVALFSFASLTCGLAPSLAVLVAARVVQGTAAAVMMPSSLAMLRSAHSDHVRRGRAVAIWAAGGGLAAACAPILGGLMTLASWRLIFLVNVPVGLLTLAALTRVPPSARRPASFDWTGQLSAIVSMAALTYGAIEAGASGTGQLRVAVPLVLAVIAALVFVLSQARGRHPMVPPVLYRNSTLRIAALVGFAFMVAFWGLPFVFTLYLQQERGLSPLATGAVFLPMMIVGGALTPLSARLVERIGYRAPIVCGLLVLAIGLLVLGMLAKSAPIWMLAATMVLVGLSGPLVMPTTTGALLNGVDGHVAGTASAVFHTSRQVGGTLAIAVFGALLADPATSRQGVRTSLTLAAVGAVLAAASALRLSAATPASRKTH